MVMNSEFFREGSEVDRSTIDRFVGFVHSQAILGHREGSCYEIALIAEDDTKEEVAIGITFYDPAQAIPGEEVFIGEVWVSSDFEYTDRRYPKFRMTTYKIFNVGGQKVIRKSVSLEDMKETSDFVQALRSGAFVHESMAPERLKEQYEKEREREEEAHNLETQVGVNAVTDQEIKNLMNLIHQSKVDWPKSN